MGCVVLTTETMERLVAAKGAYERAPLGDLNRTAGDLWEAAKACGWGPCLAFGPRSWTDKFLRDHGF